MNFDSNENKTLGIIGDGQLSKMLVQAAHSLGINVSVLGDDLSGPAHQILSNNNYVTGSIKSQHSITDFISKNHYLTIETEHFNVDALSVKSNKQIHPNYKTMLNLQDKFKQKQYFHKLGLKVPYFRNIVSFSDLDEFTNKHGFPVILKEKLGSYDGYGNTSFYNIQELRKFYAEHKNDLSTYYVEKMVNFNKELAIICVKGLDQISTYPIVETIQHKNKCVMCIVPASINHKIKSQADKIAHIIMQNIDSYGVYAIELFIDDDGEVLVNEIAPRVHNSGHYTIEACYTSQFENHVRAVLNMPLGLTELKTGCAIMINLLGNKMNIKEYEEHVYKLFNIENASIHIYKKNENREGRKMGHVTIVDKILDYKKLINRAQHVFKHMYGVNDVPEIIKHKISEITDYSNHDQTNILEMKTPTVSVIMGSDSDLKVMKEACVILEEFQVSYETLIISAHRTPNEMMEFGIEASNRNIKAIIAGAGGAAHLPGMVASLTSVPVIGVPISNTALNGKDALFSIVQMPKGVPVATVGIDNAQNAALLALRIVGTSMDEIKIKMDAYRAKMETKVRDKAHVLKEVGWKSYCYSNNK